MRHYNPEIGDYEGLFELDMSRESLIQSVEIPDDISTLTGIVDIDEVKTSEDTRTNNQDETAQFRS